MKIGELVEMKRKERIYRKEKEEKREIIER